MFGFNKKHQAELTLLRRQSDETEAQLRELLNVSRRDVFAKGKIIENQSVLLAQAQIDKAALEQRGSDAEDRVRAAEAACEVAEAHCAQVLGCHATRVRIAHLPFDPIAITARVRTVQSSLRAEWDGDKMVLYADRPLTEAEYNALVAAMPQINRT